MRRGALFLGGCLMLFAADVAEAQRSAAGGGPGPIIGGRQYGPAALGRVPESERRASAQEKDEMEALYRDIMKRSERPNSAIDHYAELPQGGSGAGGR